MAVPKKKTTKAKKGARRSHLSLKPFNLIPCPQCQQPILSHRICPNCGHYKEREVIQVKTKKQKSSK